MSGLPPSETAVLLDIAGMNAAEAVQAVDAVPFQIVQIGFYTSELDDSDTQVWEVESIRLAFIAAADAIIKKTNFVAICGSEAADACRHIENGGTVNAP
mgnify:FL=1